MSFFREREPAKPSINPLTDVQTYLRDGRGSDHGRGSIPLFPEVAKVSDYSREELWKKLEEADKRWREAFVENIAESLLESDDILGKPGGEENEGKTTEK